MILRTVLDLRLRKGEVCLHLQFDVPIVPIERQLLGEGESLHHIDGTEPFRPEAQAGVGFHGSEVDRGTEAEAGD